MSIEAPIYDVDFYSDEFIDDPYVHYQAMRDLAPVVRLPRNDGYAITRFADVRTALRDAGTFRSGHGVMMNEPVNAMAAGTSMLNMDDPAHAERRRIMVKPLLPVNLKPLEQMIREVADDVVDRLIERRGFDGVADFGRELPLAIVTRLVGLPDEGQSQMLEWANGIFNVMGSINGRFHEGLPARDRAEAFLQGVDRDRLLPGSWGARAFQLVDEGQITDAQAREMLFDYVAPALDTTINGTTAALWLLGRNPEEWEKLRADIKLLPRALDEALRLESPIRAFSRYVARDHLVDGVALPAGSRTLIVYASANRDERRWPDPERFDITRTAPQEQLAFGTGVHMCAGMHLAKLEMKSIFEALARRVKRFSVRNEQRERHNVLRGLAGFECAIEELV